jgi:hypothetical protein
MSSRTSFLMLFGIHQRLSSNPPMSVEPARNGFDCAHQKCLIHLMRDINEDLRKQPFNEEMRHIAYSFAALVKPIVETVDQFGLKARTFANPERQWPASMQRWISATVKLNQRLAT